MLASQSRRRLTLEVSRDVVFRLDRGSIDRDYHLHSRRARALACDLFNSDRQLEAMLAAC